MSDMASIDLEGFRPGALRDQPAPTLMWVEIAQLVIDRRYQRAISPAGRRQIQRIADAFDWSKFEPILVAPTPAGRFAVVDGQHRAHGAALVGLEKVPALSVPMTPAQQAAGFAAINRDRIQLSAVQIYRAELAAGAGWAMKARDAVAAAGCELATYLPSFHARKPHTVYAITLIRRMIEAGEGEAVTAGLAAIRASRTVRIDEQAAVEAYHGTIQAWLPVVARNQRYLRLDLVSVFDGIDFLELKTGLQARARQTGRPLRGLVQEAVQARLEYALRGDAA